MKHKLQMFISTSAASLLAFSALAQDVPNPTIDAPSSPRIGMRNAAHAARLNSAAKASDVMGSTVLGNHDEKIGKVEELAIDVESGRIVQVILATSGFLNLGDTLRAVPPSALRYDAANKIMHLTADKETLAATPKFSMSEWTEDSDSNHLAAVYRLYGEESNFNFIQSAGANQTMIPLARLASLQKAGKVIGLAVKNLQDESLGKVDNILLDLPSGRIVAIVISSGGFLGIGDELSAVPPTALRFTADREALQLDISKETLANAPHFKSNQWPDFAQSTYADAVYRAYKVAPYFTTNPVAQADNTARNRADGTLTPLDQGNSTADVNTTAQIRKEIIAGNDMSVNAKNVKIITLDGRVTLRGPVNTAEEKRLIGEIADRAVTSDNVDNQLEVTLADSLEK